MLTAQIRRDRRESCGCNEALVTALKIRPNKAIRGSTSEHKTCATTSEDKVSSHRRLYPLRVRIKRGKRMKIGTGVLHKVSTLLADGTKLAFNPNTLILTEVQGVYDFSLVA